MAVNVFSSLLTDCKVLMIRPTLPAYRCSWAFSVARQWRLQFSLSIGCEIYNVYNYIDKEKFLDDHLGVMRCRGYARGYKSNIKYGT